MAHKPKYAKQEPRRNTALKLLPLVLVAIVAVVLIVRSLGKGKPDDAPTTPPTTEANQPLEPVASATVGVQGDLLMHKPVITACTTEDGGYDFASIFRYVAEYTASYDYSVANLETTLGGDNYVYQGYPKFNCPDGIVEAAKDAGIDMLLTANNHCSDTTTEGVLRTVKRVREMGLTPLGTQLSDEEPKYAVVDVNGIKVGMAAYTYATSEVGGRPSLNFEKEVTEVGLVNYFTYDNLEAFYSEVQSLLSQMRSDGAEATMLYIHWGTEYSLQADSAQRMIAQKLCDMGVDVIVGGHPHVVEPMELLTSSSDSRHKTAVIYSLGNAVSNQRRDLMTLNTGHTEAERFRQTSRVGGVSVTLQTALAVNPARPAGPLVVIMLTAAPTWAMASRKLALSANSIVNSLCQQAGFIKGQTRQAAVQFAGVAIADVHQQVAFPAIVGEKRRIDFFPVEAGHWPGVETQRPAGENQICRLQGAVAKRGLLRQLRAGGEPAAGVTVGKEGR